MSPLSKKIVLILVEGDSEETLLAKRLQELFRQHDIRFRVEHGDMLYDFKSQRKSAKSIVGERIKQFLNTYRLKASDILSVLHIVDIDGIFLIDDRIIVDPSIAEQTVYKQDKILVKSDQQKERIKTRNEKRRSRMKEMSRTHSILPAKIQYQLYFFSANLEHVLFDELNADKDEKVTAVERFMDSLKCPIEQYLQQFMGLSDFKEDRYDPLYAFTWTTVIENQSEIMRLTNVPLLFQFIELELNSSAHTKLE